MFDLTMNPLEAIRTVLTKYADFSGRASRPEYWWWTLFVFVGGLVTGVVPLLGAAFSLAVFLPGLAVSARRLHDTGRSGWFIFLPLAGVPLILLGRIIQGGILQPVGGVVCFALGILLLVWYCSDGTPGMNRFGPDPKGRRSGQGWGGRHG